MGFPEKELDQIGLMKEIPIGAIPHGTDISLHHFTEHRRLTGFSPIYLELGAGDGAKALELRQYLHAMVLALDINPHAVEEANRRGIFAELGDARRVEINGWDWFTRYFLETFTAVYAQGLLCNQRGDDWKRIMRVAQLFVTPKGRIFFSDIRRLEAENPLFRAAFQDDRAYNFYEERWHERYEANRIAAERLGIPIADGEIMVA